MARFGQGTVGDAFSQRTCGNCGFRGKKIDFNKNSRASCGTCPKCNKEVEL